MTLKPASKEAKVPGCNLLEVDVGSHKRIKITSNLKNYWLLLRMHVLDEADRDFSHRKTKDIHNYLNLLINEYGLRTVLKEKSAIDLDDLHLLLYTH